ncbi:bifunctional phosphoribosylaminoimidazolecarboxamide formyltransferase/IMP cyclohydrolase [Limnoglobus roseus]|uniref:Bifunctional purine biosynthesis protein PurH n=1 Tax=Limnoglobus roseus TaxID=2598579 RepID=A0A5C1ANB4_9BACT|nr:bifunctional phosphoribosylaminoimidazolecarboxamide formyltransferase/IMP cyclohydrolase [Limnoglobus roseus]QEL20055.1 bifunctional phosphoribosylaminoimidazolecarboxamide formyltransferase/IMP cyclohydrolase PurH [Limnoglobus roseus]
MLRPIRRALFSVSDKTGLVEFATELHTKYGVELIATGGTKKSLADAGLPVKDVSELTGFPEILDGRVKTLHPAIYAGLLAKRSKPEHMATLAEHKLPEIDLVVCNLYPFEQTVAKPGVTEAEAIENIDIGGPCMVRAAAKNFDAVTIVADPSLYDEVMGQVAENQGSLTREFRRELASVAFQLVKQYDEAIEEYFLSTGEDASGDTPTDPDQSMWDDEFDPPFNLLQTLRYGENPHQRAAFYADFEVDRPCVATAEQLHGKELSYNNILDLDSALNLAREFTGPAAIVVKHNNPCGAATAPTLAEAFQLAWDGDPLSAFGGILAFNQDVDEATAQAIMTGERFVECIVAPAYSEAALTLLKGWKKNVRLLKTGPLSGAPEGLDYRRVDGGLLVQTRDVGADDVAKWEVKTKRQPTPAERDALWFAWLACKHVKSNAIVLASDTQLVGVGAGQMSRVVSVGIAVQKAGERSKGSVLASDAFFPFPDNVELAAAAGVTAIVQPGGSVKDAESIAACDKHGIAMLFTGVRHFRH